MKIVFIAYMHGFGGAEKQLILLANAMKERGHDVVIVSLYKNNACFKINEGIKRIFIPDEKKGLLLKINRFIKLKKMLQEIKPDITVNFWFQSAFFTAFIPKQYVGKVIYSERGDPGDKEYNGVISILRKIAFKKLDGFVFQTKVACEYFDNKIQNKSVIIHNPIIINQEIKKEILKRRNVIVTIGRLHEQKNQKFLIEVFSDFLKMNPEYILEIYGEGELEQSLKELCQTLRIKEYVKFMGNKKNVHDYISDAKMFILTSKYEGMPNALLEAMALGVPSISSNYNPKDSVFEFIDKGVNGLVYEEDNKQQLLESMCKIAGSREVEEQLSENGKKIYTEHLEEKIYDKWEEYLKKIWKKN